MTEELEAMALEILEAIKNGSIEEIDRASDEYCQAFDRWREKVCRV